MNPEISGCLDSSCGMSFRSKFAEYQDNFFYNFIEIELTYNISFWCTHNNLIYVYSKMITTRKFFTDFILMKWIQTDHSWTTDHSLKCSDHMIKANVCSSNLPAVLYVSWIFLEGLLLSRGSINFCRGIYIVYRYSYILFFST